MVTTNVNTDINVTNGSRGVIVGMKLGPEEPAFNEADPVVKLTRLPTYILVRLNRTQASSLPGLEDGVIPVVPAEQGYRITILIAQRNRQVKEITRSVKRLQFPITPAYAFTDYRSQGQTISAAIVGIAEPPTGGELKRANVYVALSRCSGRDSIRILRNFNQNILKKPVDLDLKKEDERLEELNSITKRWWDKISR
ncbi:hypothetical protein FRC12_021771 [Ceratobasidium sp. 428]|nr:hypothetical protein FRC12_021771 [Ceratobasidium sp. 428]